MPTIAPTNALTTTSSENCARFARSPRRGAGGSLMRRRPLVDRQPGRAPLGRPRRGAGARSPLPGALHRIVPLDAVRPAAVGDDLPSSGQLREPRRSSSSGTRARPRCAPARTPRRAHVDDDVTSPSRARRQLGRADRLESSARSPSSPCRAVDLGEPRSATCGSARDSSNTIGLGEAVPDAQPVLPSSRRAAPPRSDLEVLRRVRDGERRLARQRLDRALTLREQLEELEAARAARWPCRRRAELPRRGAP